MKLILYLIFLLISFGNLHAQNTYIINACDSAYCYLYGDLYIKKIPPLPGKYVVYYNESYDYPTIFVIFTLDSAMKVSNVKYFPNSDVQLILTKEQISFLRNRKKIN